MKPLQTHFNRVNMLIKMIVPTDRQTDSTTGCNCTSMKNNIYIYIYRAYSLRVYVSRGKTALQENGKVIIDCR